MKKTCEFCSGTGQINYFKGASRFLISSEECPDCGGFGFHLSEEETLKKKRPDKKKTGR